MSEPSPSQAGAPHAAESPEFDFGPFKAEIVKLWGDVIRLKSGRYQEVQDREPEIEGKYDEIVRLSAETLIASGGEIEEPYNIMKSTKGVFAALHEALVEASKVNPMYLMPAQTQELTFTKRIAAEAVRILLARQKAPEQPASGPEVAEVVAATSEEARNAGDDGDAGDATK